MTMAAATLTSRADNDQQKEGARGKWLILNRTEKKEREEIGNTRSTRIEPPQKLFSYWQYRSYFSNKFQKDKDKT